MKAFPFVTCVLGLCFAASLFAQSTPAPSPATSAAPWGGKAAAAYLDERIAWWMGWPSAARDHDTFCVSCHTAVPYAMARPSLRSTLGEQTASTLERRLLDNVAKRVRMWKEVERQATHYFSPGGSRAFRGAPECTNFRLPDHSLGDSRPVLHQV